MAQGAPVVSTDQFYRGYNSNPLQDAQAAKFRAQHVIENIPVYGRELDYSVPSVSYRFRGGWIAPDVPVIPGPTYPTAVGAPDIEYRNRAYAGLISMAASPNPTPNRKAYVLSAPEISTTF